MPRVVIHLIFILPNLFCSPKLRGYFSIYTDALIEYVTSEIGYEAVLSDVAYSIKSFENIGFKLKFSGYNDKIAEFIKIFLEMMIRIQQDGFGQMMVKLALEKSIKNYKNLNVEVDQRTGNNRLIFLLDHTYHASLVIKELESFSMDEFNNQYCKEELLSKVQMSKIFVAGNMNESDATNIAFMVKEVLKLQENAPIDLLQLKTIVKRIGDNQVVEWDCLHEKDDNADKKSESEEEDSESPEEEGEEEGENEDESMEDLTNEDQDKEMTAEKQDESEEEEEE